LGFTRLLAKHACINNDHCRKADALTSIQNESYGNRLAELHIARLAVADL
jgi:hypothetical protein